MQKSGSATDQAESDHVPGHDHVHYPPGGGYFLERAVEGFSSVTVAAFGSHDNDPAFFAGRLAGSHAFYRLVEILIQGITAVACYDDVSWNSPDFPVLSTKRNSPQREPFPYHR